MLQFVQLNDVNGSLQAGDFLTSLMSSELDRALHFLRDAGLNQIAGELLRYGIHQIAIIPYGLLSAFPLSAVPVSLSGAADQPMGKGFTLVIAPNAITLGIARQHLKRSSNRHTQIITAGRPIPMPDGLGDLEWAEAEAETIEKVAKRKGYSKQAVLRITSRDMQKLRVIQAWNQCWFVHLATHAEYRIGNPLQSRIILAGDGEVECCSGTRRSAAMVAGGCNQ